MILDYVSLYLGLCFFISFNALEETRGKFLTPNTARRVANRLLGSGADTLQVERDLGNFSNKVIDSQIYFFTRCLLMIYNLIPFRLALYGLPSWARDHRSQEHTNILHFYQHLSNKREAPNHRQQNGKTFIEYCKI